MEEQRFSDMAKVETDHFYKKSHVHRFLGQKRSILVDFTPKNKTFNAVIYDETLIKLRHAFQKKTRGLLSDFVI